MSIESAKFIVQRGASQFKCQGDELKDKLEVGDLMVVQHDGDDEASKWEAKGIPWENHDGGVWHVRNITNGPVYMMAGKVPAYDLDGNSLGDISSFNEELVFLTPPDTQNLFFNNGTGQNWEFGDLTNTSRVTSMTKMFELCSTFTGQGLSSWDVSNVTNMLNMFHRTDAFNQDISSWDVSSVENMSHMFDSATAFNQDLSEWCVDPEPAHEEFDTLANAWTEPKPVWGTCPRGENS